MEKLKISDKLKILKGWKKEEITMLVVIALLVIFVIYGFYPEIKAKLGDKKTSIEIVKISGCDECFNLDLISSVLKSDNSIELKKEKTLDYRSEEATKLINKYGIKKVPALIVLGKIDKIKLDEEIFRKSKNYAVFDKSIPYIENNKVIGLVKLKEVYDTSCKDCASLSRVKTQLEGMGIKVENYETIDSKSIEGKALIKTNNITSLPALIVSKNIEEYWWVFSSIKNAFSETDDYYLFSQQIFPYKEISTGSVRGKVSFSYLVNKSCEECYNVSILKQAFQNLGVYVDREYNVDVNSEEGKNLLTSYNITAIPTVILSSEISDYKLLKKVLEGVGTFENNKFVFRDLEQLNVNYQKIGGE